MLDKLIDFALQFVERFYVFVVVKEYERGVVLRLGKYSRTLEPGFHWLWPAIEDAIHDGVVTRTICTDNQIVTTADGKTVALRAMLRWRIRDIRKALLEVEGLADVTRDVTYGLIERLINASTWDRVRQPDFTDELTKQARRAGFRYGVEVEQLQFSDLSLTKSLTINKN